MSSSGSSLGEQGMAQWWERSPPTNVARVQIPASSPYVGWVCCWFYSGFPLSTKTNILKFQFDHELDEEADFVDVPPLNYYLFIIHLFKCDVVSRVIISKKVFWDSGGFGDIR